jgi:hypothetical protein
VSEKLGVKSGPSDDELRDIVEEIGKRLYDSLNLPHDNDRRGGWLARLWLMTKRDIIDRIRRAQPPEPCLELSAEEKDALKWSEDECSNPCSATSGLGRGRVMGRLVRRLLSRAEPCRECERKDRALDNSLCPSCGMNALACATGNGCDFVKDHYDAPVPRQEEVK